MNTVTYTHQPQNVKSLMNEKEYHSLKETFKLLCMMVDPKKTPRLPKELRNMAQKCLDNYPHSRDWGKISDTFAFFNPK